MKILVACEESQAVTIELRKLGHEAYSCDIEPCSGGHPEWHIQGDVTPLLSDKWDMIIAFPPCTHLAVSGARWFDKKRKDGRWVYGDLWNRPYAQNTIGIVSFTKDGIPGEAEVIPETVGQYTGLDDKNGVKIFEGDIVTAWSQGYQATGEVKQRIDGLWLMYPAYQHGKLWGLCPNPKGATTVEVIGNIHDNPEMMEG